MKQANGTKKKGKALRVLLGIVIGLAVVVGGFATFIVGGKERTMKQQIASVALDAVADGTYEGRYNALRWSNTVAVSVADHCITDISVVKPQVFMTQESVRTLTDRVLEAQSPDVDTVSSATVDSKAFLKAVENALQSAAKGR